MRYLAIVCIGAALVGACAAPSARISIGLQRYGLDTARADCVGSRLQDDLTIGQLGQLGRAAAAYGTGDADPGVLTVSDLLRVAGQIDDPAIPLAVGKAAATCRVLP